MADAFNNLSPAEAERLALLAEECAEVIQVVGKILRHGYRSTHPADPNGLDNGELLAQELGDVRAAVTLMLRAGDLDEDLIEEARDSKLERVGQYLHHNKARLTP